MTDVRAIPVADIEISPNRRPVRDEDVERLADSIGTIGLQTPITVQEDATGNFVLVAGAHRLAAAQYLGWQKIPCFVLPLSEGATARMWEIAENLCRTELTVLERKEHEAEWIKLADQMFEESERRLAEERRNSEQNISVQVAPKLGRPDGGISRASRELGIDTTAAKRAVKIAALPAEAKAIAREAGLDNNQSALLAAARAPDPVANIRAEVERRQAKPALRIVPNAAPASAAEQAPMTEQEQAQHHRSMRQYANILDAWQTNTDPEGRNLFVAYLSANGFMRAAS